MFVLPLLEKNKIINVSDLTSLPCLAEFIIECKYPLSTLIEEFFILYMVNFT